MSPPFSVLFRPKRKRYSNTEREAIFDSFKGICVLCSQPIGFEKWEVVHIAIPHVWDGKEVGPGHKRCHDEETATVTIPLITKTKRLRRRHIGAQRPDQALPGGTSDPISKGIDGTVKARLSPKAKHGAVKALSPFLDFTKLPVERQVRGES
jgi:hypothetical protein